MECGSGSCMSSRFCCWVSTQALYPPSCKFFLELLCDYLCFLFKLNPKENVHIGIKTVSFFVDREASECTVAARHGSFA